MAFTPINGYCTITQISTTADMVKGTVAAVTLNRGVAPVGRTLVQVGETVWFMKSRGMYEATANQWLVYEYNVSALDVV